MEGGYFITTRVAKTHTHTHIDTINTRQRNTYNKYKNVEKSEP